MKIKSIKQANNLNGKRVLVRVDYNLPFINGKVDLKQDLRIRISLDTLNFLKKSGCTIILLAHLGRPKGWDKKLSLEIVAKHLSKLLKTPVKFLSDDISKKDISSKIKKGSITLLENIRFYDKDSSIDNSFAKNLAKLADIYVNEAFSVSHRSDRLISGVQKYLSSYSGLYLEKELEHLSKLLPKNIKKNNRPYIALMGGAKISTKVNLITNLLKSVDNILLGGALISGILKYKGYDVGGTLAEGIASNIIKKIVYSKKIVLPVDFVVGKIGDANSAHIVKLDKKKVLCTKDEGILDIGPETILQFSKYIKSAQTIVWNGPMGYFEELSFAYGTFSLARLVAARGRGRAYVVVGGGETVTILKLAKVEEDIDWISAGGGSMLSYLAGEKLPGLKKIVK